MLLKNCNIIVAVDANLGIGKNGGLLCHLPDDLRHFKSVTMGHAVVMGRKTYESLPVRPLPGRDNYVISTSAEIDGAVVVRHPLDVLKLVCDDDFFVIGGASVYSFFLPYANRLYVTHINHVFDDADCFFPPLCDESDGVRWQAVSIEAHEADERNPYSFTFVTYERC